MIELGRKGLTIGDVVAVARGFEEVRLSGPAAEGVLKSRRAIEKIEKSGRVAYGITTGFGALKHKVISQEDLGLLQKNLVESHAVGVGGAFPEDVVRAVMLIRANTLAQGFSGVRLETVQTLADMLNKKVHPVIPEKGSVGASGDLAPLSHMALVLIGEGEAICEGKRVSGKEAMEKAGIKTLELQSKEGLALNNGTAVMTAVGALAVHDALLLAENADVAAAMSLEALMGTDKAFDEKIHSAKPHPGQLACARNMRRLTEGSEIIESHKDCDRIQDAYSLRCVPQVHGASRDAISYARGVVETEINSATDNPLVFGENEIVSGGNFHGQPVALAMDFLGIAAAELGDISERRIARLVDPNLNEMLGAFLVKDSGINSGYMIAQYTAAALVSENKVLAHPASVDSIPTCGNQEDHVSMGTIAARKAAQIIENVQNIIAIEFLCASQALDFRLPLKAGFGSRKAHELIRKSVPHLAQDRVLYKEIELVRELVKSGEIVKSAQG